LNTFAIRTLKELKLLDIEVLSKKDRDPKDNPGLQLSVMGDFVSDVLDQFAPGSSRHIFEPGEQAGVDDATDLTALTAFAKGLGEFPFAASLTGYTGEVDYGTGGKSNILFEGAALHSFRFFPKDGGSVLMKFKIDIPNCSKKTLGELGSLKSQKVHLTMLPPVVKDDAPKQPDAPLFDMDTQAPTNPFMTPEEAMAAGTELP
jgi:hypothetical protein